MIDVKYVRQYVEELKNQVALKKTEGFVPNEYHLNLTFDKKKGWDPIAYMDYDAKNKLIMGNNRSLMAKLVIFLSRTNNHHIIPEMKANLE